jgi:FAD/FMN-containing dehydrogenase
LGQAPFVARAGNGVIYHREASKPPKGELPVKLMRRLKDAFDPKRILPELPS